MESEHILVQEILKKHGVSVSQLADKVGMADSTLYEYTGGRKKNIPLSIWRALYALTEDVRIPDLIVGEVNLPPPPVEVPHGLWKRLDRVVAPVALSVGV